MKKSKIQNRKSEIKRLVVIAASFGGVDTLIKFMSGMPTKPPISVLIVQHLKTGEEKTHLPEILTRHSLMRVCLAENNMPLEPGVAYVAKPGKHLRLKNGHLILDDGEPVNYVRPSADVLFTSAAEAFGSKIIAVVLTGSGRDGTNGCLRIKATGGVTIAQDKETSTFFAMPEAAIKAGVIDFVLPIHEIAGKIIELLAM